MSPRAVIAFLIAFAVTACAAQAAGQAAPRKSPTQNKRYSDPAGWSFAHPQGMHLERSRAQLRVSFSEVTIASFVPRTAVLSGSSASGSWFRTDPPLDAQGRFPSDAVAFRIVYQDGGPVPELELPETQRAKKLAPRSAIAFGASLLLASDFLHS